MTERSTSSLAMPALFNPVKTFLVSVPIGAWYMILSALAFSVMALFVKIAGQRGIPVVEIVAARAMISLLISYIAVKRARVPIWGNRKGALVTRGLLGCMAISCFYYSLTRLPLAEATVIQYLHPMFTAGLAALFLSERPTLAVIACIFFSITGLMLVVRPAFIWDGEVGFEPLAITAAILGAFGSACCYVLVRKLNETEHPAVIVFYYPLITLPAMLPFLVTNFVMPKGIDWLILLAMGGATQVGQVAITRGMMTETASRATSFSYMQVLFSACWGILFFSEIPTLLTLSGAVLIIFGAFLNVAWKR